MDRFDEMARLALEKALLHPGHESETIAQALRDAVEAERARIILAGKNCIRYGGNLTQFISDLESGLS